MWTETLHLIETKDELKMKKNIFRIVSLLTVAAVSCSIDDIDEIPVNNSLEFTATIATDDVTRTTVDV